MFFLRFEKVLTFFNNQNLKLTPIKGSDRIVVGQSMSIANYITILRLIAIPAIGYFYLKEEYSIALYLLLGAGFSDLLDGYLARRLGQRTKLGSILDPLADKSLMLVCFSCLVYTGQIPLWLMLLVIGRDIYIVMGVSFLKWRCDKFYIRPTYLSKLTTFFQLGFLFFTFLRLSLEIHAFAFLISWTSLVMTSQKVMMVLVVLMTFASAAHYSMVAWAIFKEDLKQKRVGGV